MMTPEMVDQMNLDKSLAFYKDRFSDASDFTFVFVGSFDLATMKPLVERSTSPRCPPRAARRPGRTSASSDRQGVDREARRKGIEPKSRADARLFRAVPVQPGAARRDSRDGAGARDPPAGIAARGSRRHLQRLRVGRLFEDPPRGVHA